MDIKFNSKKLKLHLLIAVSIFIIIIFCATSFINNDNRYNMSSSSIETSSIPQSKVEISSIYIDKYLVEIKDYSDVTIQKNDINDEKYVKESLLIGDSNTEALANFYYVPLQYVLGFSGMGIQQVTQNSGVYFAEYTDPVTIPTAVGILQPRRVIINFGTNNAGGLEIKSFIKLYVKAIKSIEKSYPYCDIIVESIFPVGKDRSYPKIKQTDIDEMNLALAQMCRDEGYKYLNTAEYLKGDDGFIKTELVSKDGVHLNKAGYTAVLEYINSHKYITNDNRPNRSYIPQRVNPPQSSEENSTQ